MSEDYEEERPEELDDFINALYEYLKLYPELKGITLQDIEEVIPRHIAVIVQELEERT